MALEMESARWKGFRDTLNPSEQESFDELMDLSRDHASAGGCACNPIVFEPMAMSILLGQQKELTELKGKLKCISNLQEQCGVNDGHAPQANKRFAAESNKTIPQEEASPEEAKPAGSTADPPKTKPAPKNLQRGLFNFG
jgi:hypothetical protein